MRNGYYQCNPPGENEVAESKRFTTVEEAAIFLLSNPDWKIWLGGNSTARDGQLSRGIVVEGVFDRDELLRRGILK
jgi:hypothetical protein